MTAGEFSVFQFFNDDYHECVRQGVGGQEAVETARSYMERPAAQLGVIRRVIITDGGDNTTFDWRFGEGVVFPTKAEGADFPGAKDEPPKEWLLEENLKQTVWRLT